MTQGVTGGFVTLYSTNFLDPEGKSFSPLEPKFFLRKNGEQISLESIEGPRYLSGDKVLKVVISTKGLEPGVYEAVWQGKYQDVALEAIQLLELVPVDALNYFINRTRYNLFDHDASTYPINLFDETHIWPDEMIVNAIKQALWQINHYKCPDSNGRGYTLETASSVEPVLLTGSTAYALEQRAIREVRDEYTFSDVVSMTYRRDYRSVADSWKADFQLMLEQLAKRMPDPLGLRGPLVISEILRRYLSHIPGYSNIYAATWHPVIW